VSGLVPSALLRQLIARDDLDAAAMEGLIGAIMDGEVAAPETAAILVALRMKGETGSEVAAAARAMRARAVAVELAAPERAVDTCGTGGDGADTVNISTAAALVAASAGLAVAKHGNRSVSSRCGSADVLEHCGVRLDLAPAALAALVASEGIAFLFAPRLHPAMAAVMPVRRALGVRTVFNLLGPLTNPAGVRRQVIGVWDRTVQDLMAAALAELGVIHALVVHSADGLDELSVCAPTRVLEVRDGAPVRELLVDPVALGLGGLDPAGLRGGDVATNARRLEEVLGGRDHSAATAAVALNAAAALVVGGAAADLAAGLARAREILAAGTALTTLSRLAARSHELAADG
jgi:anthranilate phosphoribosyltransferase